MPRFESRGGRFLELEVEDTALMQLEGAVDDSEVAEPSTRTFATADEARYAAARLIARRRRLGYQRVGQARHLGGGHGEVPSPASVIALEAYFAAADPQFLSELMRPTPAAQASGLAGLAERWYQDARPWARDMLRAYIDDGCDRPWHKALVKRLFKLAEAAGDDELMTHFLVAFDRLSRRYLIKESNFAGWDRAAQRAIVVESARLVQDPSIRARLPEPEAAAGNPGKSGAHGKPGKRPAEEAQFTRVTRRYLARRAYRYFRMLAHRDLARYGRAMRLALPRYRDESLSTAT
ncbi:MAG TPA: hypothetical protein VHW23_34610, partial [Kofleriaceae bacterium]|nr:hypothetical protein [Kofleriaceae bacterium]